MKEIINWLKNIEIRAHEIYAKAALTFNDDKELAQLLNNISEEEAWHYHIMTSAEKYINNTKQISPAIKIDDQLNNKVISKFDYINEGLDKQSISKYELIEKIVDVELSEWNDIFLYVVKSLTEEAKIFKYSASRIQSHIKSIEYFLENDINYKEILKTIQTIPSIWTENILIVDDEKIICDLLKSLFDSDGNIHIAYDGAEAFEMIKDTYYKLIITDIDMPHMDGMELFKEVAKISSNIKNNFLFMTGNLTPERIDFFNENNVKYIAKPMDIFELRDMAKEFILRN